MRITPKDIPEKTKLIKPISYQKIFGSAMEINVESSDAISFIQNVSHMMIKTCMKYGGVGLAAPQIGIPKKIFVIKEFTNPQMWDFTDAYNVYVNPKYVPLTDSGKWMMEEGCLSVPNKTYEVERFNKIKASYYDLDLTGKVFLTEDILEGYQARVFQHEFDHLISRSIVDRYNKQLEKKSSKQETSSIKNERQQFLSNFRSRI